MLRAECDQEDRADDNHQTIFPADPRSSIVAPHVITFSNAHRSLRSVPSRDPNRFSSFRLIRLADGHGLFGFLACVEEPSQATDGRALDFLRNSGSTFSTSASAVMPCFLRRIGTAPCSMNWSGQPMRTTGVLIICECRCSITAQPKQLCKT